MYEYTRPEERARVLKRLRDRGGCQYVCIRQYKYILKICSTALPITSGKA